MHPRKSTGIRRPNVLVRPNQLKKIERKPVTVESDTNNDLEDESSQSLEPKMRQQTNVKVGKVPFFFHEKFSYLIWNMLWRQILKTTWGVDWKWIKLLVWENIKNNLSNGDSDVEYIFLKLVLLWVTDGHLFYRQLAWLSLHTGYHYQFYQLQMK